VRFVNRYAKHCDTHGPVFTLRQLRAFAIVKQRKGKRFCRLCGDSWYKNEEHHSWVGTRRCLLSERAVA